MEGSMETLYEYLLENYKPNEPIFLAELQIEGMSRANLRQQIKKLTDAGKVKRFDNGVYFLPNHDCAQRGRCRTTCPVQAGRGRAHRKG